MKKVPKILDMNLKRAKDSLRNNLHDKKKTTPLKNTHMQLNLAGRQQKQNLVCRTQRQTCWNQHTCMKNKAIYPQYKEISRNPGIESIHMYDAPCHFRRVYRIASLRTYNLYQGTVNLKN